MRRCGYATITFHDKCPVDVYSTASGACVRTADTGGKSSGHIHGKDKTERCGANSAYNHGNEALGAYDTEGQGKLRHWTEYRQRPEQRLGRCRSEDCSKGTRRRVSRRKNAFDRR